MTEKNYQELYTQIGRLIAACPEFPDYQSVHTKEGSLWFARAHALVEEVGVGVDAVGVRLAVDQTLNSGAWSAGTRQVKNAVFRALAYCERQLPLSAAGAFIAAGDVLDAYSAITKLFEKAQTDIFIVDPYLDESALVDFGAAVPLGITLRLLADLQNVKPTLAPSVKRWSAQYGPARPIEARVTVPRMLHDRAIFVDGSQAWILTQSLKDFAKRSPAELMRADDTAALKIAAYDKIWQTATPV